MLLKHFESPKSSRRSFVRVAAASAFGSSLNVQAADTNQNVFGPRHGYSPQIGTLVSEMIWMREAVLRTVKGMNQAQLDFLLDTKANRIGALLLHLAATDKLYYLNTLESVPMQRLAEHPAFKDFGVAMDLGEPARESIKGHDLGYYLDHLQQTRDATLAEFRKRDDAWLLTVDKSWGWGPTNNLCKWFHVCEHESHHLGQIAMLKSRAPGAKPETGD